MLSNRDRNIQFIRNPHLKHLELRWSRYRQHAFDKHTHDTYSIGVVLTGQTNFFHHHHPQLIGSGAIALINPDEVHACNPQKGSTLSYGMLYVEPGLIQEVTSSLSGQEAGIAHFTSPVINDAQLFFDLNDLCLLITHGVAGFEVESKLYEILARLLQRYSDVKSRAEQFEASRTMVERGRLYLMDNLSKNVGLPELAAQSGLSPYHFLREFRKQYGLPPHTYQLQQRVKVAKRLLVKGEPIVRVANEVGFADQSHFTRKFKALVGATPGQYQRAVD